MTFAEVQAYLGVKSRKTLLKYITSGELLAFKLGGTRWRLLRSDVDRFLRNDNLTHPLEIADNTSNPRG